MPQTSVVRPCNKNVLNHRRSYGPFSRINLEVWPPYTLREPVPGAAITLLSSLPNRKALEMPSPFTGTAPPVSTSYTGRCFQVTSQSALDKNSTPVHSQTRYHDLPTYQSRPFSIIPGKTCRWLLRWRVVSRYLLPFPHAPQGATKFLRCRSLVIRQEICSQSAPK